MSEIPVLVCVLDGFRADAAARLAKVLGYKSGRHGEVIPPFSFEPDASFLCGRHPDETNSGTHFWYAPDSSPFWDLKQWFTPIDSFPGYVQLFVRRLLRARLVSRVRSSCSRDLSTARIPFYLLPYFDKVRKGVHSEERAFGFPSIFDLLRSVNRRWVYIGVPVSSGRLEDVRRAVRQRSILHVSLVFLFIGDLDRIGHRYGPDSSEYTRALERVGGVIRDVLGHLQSFEEGTRALIFGDHGMVRVTRWVDVQAVLKQLSVRAAKDYVYFLDSTLARFWFFNERAREVVTKAMRTLGGGRLITDEDRAKYHIRYPHNRFGELIWWADGGTLILPNFWQGKKPVKGMHGYRREIIDNHAGFLLVDPDLGAWEASQEPLEMVDLFATMVDLLGVKMPDGAHGTSFYRRIT